MEDLPVLAGGWNGRSIPLARPPSTAVFCEIPCTYGESSIPVYNLLHADTSCKPMSLHKSSRLYYCIGLLNLHSGTQVFEGDLGIKCIMEKIKSSMTVNKNCIF